MPGPSCKLLAEDFTTYQEHLSNYLVEEEFTTYKERLASYLQVGRCLQRHQERLACYLTGRCCNVAGRSCMLPDEDVTTY